MCRIVTTLSARTECRRRLRCFPPVVFPPVPQAGCPHNVFQSSKICGGLAARCEPVDQKRDRQLELEKGEKASFLADEVRRREGVRR